ncbi:hypothetical protein RR46_10368, partial [Papilio xuthus]
KLADAPERNRPDAPLRAKSVNLAERPRCQYVRSVRSADSKRSRFPDKQFFPKRRPAPDIKSVTKPCEIAVKQQKRKKIEKIPLALSVQNITIPMRYDPNRSTSKRPDAHEHNDTKTKSFNPKQVGENKRLCHTVGGKETENKLLVQISEAEQVTDFERILNRNAVVWERARGHVWRASVAHASAASVTSASLLPRSSYSLHAVSEAYHRLFQQHEESVRPLVERYRQETVAEQKRRLTPSVLQNDWYDNLHDLAEFYEDDQLLHREIESITENLIDEEVKATEVGPRNKNFKVNLADLIGLHVSGEGVSPIGREDRGLSPEAECGVTDEKEWLAPSMSSNLDNRSTSERSENVDSLADNLDSIQLGYDAKVPTITFSNCCEGRVKSDSRDNTDVVIDLSVPSIESIDEARPPM